MKQNVNKHRPDFSDYCRIMANINDTKTLFYMSLVRQ